MSFLFHRKLREPIFGWSFFQSLVTNSSEHEEYSIFSDGRHFGKKIDFKFHSSSSMAIESTLPSNYNLSVV